MSKNFETIHVNGVYRSRNQGNWVVVPKERYVFDNYYMQEKEWVSYRVGLDNTNWANINPRWSYCNARGVVSSNSQYDLVEYLGEYDWETGEIIEAEEEAQDLQQSEKNLVSESQIGTEKVYEFGIFRLKKTTYTNGCESTIEIGCRGFTQSENPLEYLTFDEFKQLQELVKDISVD
jgi:hypothetical protein